MPTEGEPSTLIIRFARTLEAEQIAIGAHGKRSFLDVLRSGNAGNLPGQREALMDSGGVARYVKPALICFRTSDEEWRLLRQLVRLKTWTRWQYDLLKPFAPGLSTGQKDWGAMGELNLDCLWAFSSYELVTHS